MQPEAGARSVLFASVLNAHAPQAELRARLLRVVPLILALHLLAVGILARDRREPERAPVLPDARDLPVLRLLAARPVSTSALAAAAVPAQAATQRRVARKVPSLLKPAPLAAPAPKVAELPPPPEETPEVDDTPSASSAAPEAGGGAALTGVALDPGQGMAVGEGSGGVLGGVLSSGPPASPSLTPEERDAWVERYMKALIRERFERVRYPHLAAAAGITGEVLMRVSINAQGRLLKLELLGRCPHPVLCDSAQETVRNAEPFPPPPPELGSPCVLELPFRYRLH
jgi:protein TonB